MAQLTATKRGSVVGIFERSEDARKAIEALRRARFSTDDIGLVMQQGEKVEVVNPVEQGSVAGAVTGGIVGGLLGASLALTIPGGGILYVAGLLAGFFGGAAAGVVAGGLLGALAGLGIPEEEARYYEKVVQTGDVLVVVRAGARSGEAEAILEHHGASKWQSNSAAE